PDGPAARPGLVLVPIGGGGLLSGTAAALRGLEPECRVVGVEPVGAASMKASLDAGEPVTLDEVESVADGLKPVRPGDVTFRHARELVDDVVTVTDEAIREATVWCAREGLVVEPSGAATVAALASGRVAGVPAPDEGATVAVLSGGNVDTDLLGRWLLEA
ncbi:MAG: pyridoxal-phosphate dependent enzyme, partial [Gemmatimonadota bacterium]